MVLLRTFPNDGCLGIDVAHGPNEYVKSFVGNKAAEGDDMSRMLSF